jgi:NTP pyrophosphatase (non-canonical NTP hydrolase)
MDEMDLIQEGRMKEREDLEAEVERLRKELARAKSSAEEAFQGLLRALEQNSSRSPWAQSREPLDWLRSLEEEAEEMGAAITTGTPAEIDSELGDLLWSWIALAISHEMNSGTPIARIISQAEAKLRARKPWIFDALQPQPRDAADEARMYAERKAYLAKVKP